MTRYNHRLAERRLLEKWGSAAERPQTAVCTRAVPQEGEGLSLENARLLILCDFFGFLLQNVRPQIYWLNAEGEWLESARGLGLAPSLGWPADMQCSLGLFCRDFPASAAGEIVFCGRFTGEGELLGIAEDFGADALRVYFLYQGPPARDFQFQWEPLAAAHRFVQRIWRLGQRAEGEMTPGQKLELEALCRTLARRLEQKKPHTALAALMQYLKGRKSFCGEEKTVIAHLLKPYTPFLAAELLSLGGGGDPGLKLPGG